MLPEEIDRPVLKCTVVSGNPAVLGYALRPEALRPHLSMGLPFSCMSVSALTAVLATVLIHNVQIVRLDCAAVHKTHSIEFQLTILQIVSGLQAIVMPVLGMRLFTNALRLNA